MCIETIINDIEKYKIVNKSAYFYFYLHQSFDRNIKNYFEFKVVKNYIKSKKYEKEFSIIYSKNHYSIILDCLDHRKKTLKEK